MITIIETIPRNSAVQFSVSIRKYHTYRAAKAVPEIARQDHVRLSGLWPDRDWMEELQAILSSFAAPIRSEDCQLLKQKRSCFGWCRSIRGAPHWGSTYRVERCL